MKIELLCYTNINNTFLGGAIGGASESFEAWQTFTEGDVNLDGGTYIPNNIQILYAWGYAVGDTLVLPIVRGLEFAPFATYINGTEVRGSQYLVSDGDLVCFANTSTINEGDPLGYTYKENNPDSATTVRYKGFVIRVTDVANVTANIKTIQVGNVSNIYFDLLSDTKYLSIAPTLRELLTGGIPAYFCFFVKNEGLVETRNLTFWQGQGYPDNAITVELAAPFEGINSSVELLPNRSTAPTGVTFGSHVDQSNALSLTLPPLGYSAIWLKVQSPQNTSFLVGDLWQHFLFWGIS